MVSWIVMTLTHELGHIVGGWSGGANLVDLELSPWRLPYSIHSPDPHPLLTLWSGPILGVVVPVFAAAVIRRRPVWFVADFCILANGSYLALAWVAGDPHLDTPRLFQSGATTLSVVAYCILTICLGYVRFRNGCIFYLSSNGSSRETNVTQPPDSDLN
ncbi:hypothetical protein RBSWK_02286 [Rhodopirellula baltica SWK14]|uniref:Uncharacterized protein n=2 Tax=Rhodopirellula baltica TaxID=265606 RepID=L7CIR6_RHOBT|nr:hypothetical protein RBSWK_02286 [Rhodopirellula baltica SWK14]